MENLQSSFNKPCSSPKDPLLSPTVAASCGSCNATTQAAKDIKMSLEEQLVLNLCNPELRGSALAELAKKREMFSDLALLLWHSFGTMAILIQEILAAYPTYLPLSASAASRACNALALLQTVASHPETRIPFLRAKIPMYFYSYLDCANNGKGFEPLRLTSLSILGALVKGDNVEVEVINFLLRSEVIPLCLQIMEKGSEVSKVEPSTKILKYVVCCYLRLTYHPRALVALRINFPEALKDGTFDNCLGEDTEAVQWLQQLLDRLKDGGVEGASLPGADPPADGTAWGGGPPPVPVVETSVRLE
ncbi:hypothetical protein PR202_ga28370 [Eleusine coracana subsp. coracana]|uniref:Cell differentiation protein rcd1 n=1 Tax=Eleusine coracana subsp. coracana TaxID=191504 RepID=A0AAV5DGX7_ELECO|nr:hypothetical protein PR202_ga28370 [Eleusine coracana subsp. coracana]